MSKTKFLGIPAGGKRAGWIEMEGGGSAGVGGGGAFKFTVTNDGSGNFTADKTVQELVAAYQEGNILMGELDLNGELISLYLRSVGSSFMFFGFTSMSGTPWLIFVQIRSDGDVMLIPYTLTAEEAG